MWRSANGLMDRADPSIKAVVVECLDESTKQFGITWHHLRHRHLGDGHWVDFHLVFEDETSVKEAHDIATHIERAVKAKLGPATAVTSHLEPAEDHERIHGHAPGELEP